LPRDTSSNSSTYIKYLELNPEEGYQEEELYIYTLLEKQQENPTSKREA
jgi:hypothetical protein